MNIAIFSPSQNPYSETFIQAHKNHLKGNVFYFYGTGAGIQLENHGQVFQPAGFKSQLISKLKKTKPLNPWQQLVLKLRELAIDAVLVEYGTHAYHLLPLLREIKIPVTVHFHGYDASMHAEIKRVQSYKEVFAIARYVIAVSQVMRNKLLDLGCPENKLVLNTYGPRNEFLDIKAQFLKKQLIAIGRFTDKKAPYYTILAFSQISKQHPEATLVMAGKGELLNTCINLVSYLNLKEQVIFPGVIDAAHFQEYLVASRAFVQHSITALSGDMEGTPLAVLEASAAGLPVIATKHAGINDVVLHEVTGLLCDEHDVNNMAQHMDALLSNKKYAQELGNAAAQRIQDHYMLEKHISKLDELLSS